MTVNSPVLRDLRWRVRLMDRAAIMRNVYAFSVAAFLSVSFGVFTIPLVWLSFDLLRIPDSLASVVIVVLAVIAIWVFVWTFERTLHVERLIASGLDVDEPVFDIKAQRRDLRKLRLK